MLAGVGHRGRNGFSAMERLVANPRRARAVRSYMPGLLVDAFETELISDRVWRTRTQLEHAIVE